jgi:hypothetical protein
VAAASRTRLWTFLTSSSKSPPSTTMNGFSSMALRQDSMASRTGAGCEAMKKPAKWR